MRFAFAVAACVALAVGAHAGVDIDTFAWFNQFPADFTCSLSSLQAFGGDPSGAKDSSAALVKMDNASQFDANSLIFVGPGTYRISKSISLNKPVNMAPGASFSIDAGATLAFNAAFSAPASLALRGSGGVRFGYGVQTAVRPEWWGARANGSSDDSPAINQAVAAAEEGTMGVVFQAGATYGLGSPVQMLPGALLLAPASATFKALRSGIDGVYFDVRTTGGMYQGLQQLPNLVGFARAVVISDPGVIDVYAPSVQGATEAVRLQSVRAVGKGRQVVQARVQIDAVADAVHAVVLFSLLGGATMQGSSVQIGAWTDRVGTAQSLVYYRRTGGGLANWDSNTFTFGTVAPKSGTKTQLVLVRADFPDTLYRVNLLVGRLDPMPGASRYTNANLQDSVISLAPSSRPMSANLELTHFKTGSSLTGNFNDIFINYSPSTAVTATTASNSLKSFNGGAVIAQSQFNVRLRASVPSRDPRLGSKAPLPPNGKVWPVGEIRRFYVYHGLAQNGQLRFITVPQIGAGCTGGAGSVAVTGIFDNSAAVKWELQLAVQPCVPITVADMASGKVNVSFPMIVGSMGSSL